MQSNLKAASCRVGLKSNEKLPPEKQQALPIRVSAIALEELVNERFAALIQTRANLHLVSSYSDAKAALHSIARTRPDVAVIGQKLLRMSGPRSIGKLHSTVPSMGIFIVGGADDRSTILASIEYGATGYAVKLPSLAEFERAITMVARGSAYLGPRVQQAVVRYFRAVALRASRNCLTPREQEICHLLLTNSEKEIAMITNLSVGTIHSHVKAIYSKQGVHSRLELLQSWPNPASGKYSI